MNMRTYNELMRERSLSEKEISRIEEIIRNAPPGRLEHRVERGASRYWHSTGSGKKLRRRYLRSNEQNLITRLGDKAYARKLLKGLKQNSVVLDMFAGRYVPDLHEDVYKKMRMRDIHVSETLYKSKEQKRDEFLNKVCEVRNNYEISSPVVTADGTVVRSKSEAIIADCLSRRGIAYRYELPVKRRNGRYLFPDFTMYFPEYDLIIIWEHFGRMDDPEYADRSCKKIYLYNDEGYVVGRNMVFTMETAEVPLSSMLVECIIDELIEKYSIM